MQKDEWLASVSEEILQPELPICDAHHHLLDHPGNRYLLDELLADTGSGHNIASTVFVECMSMYRAKGPEALRPVGETEFVNGIAAMSASGRYGETEACAGIVSFADMALGSAVGEVLDAHMAASSRFRGIRHAVSWDPHPEIGKAHTNPTQGLLGEKRFRQGAAELGKRGLSFDSWLYHHQIPELTAFAEALPEVQIVLNHFGGPLGIGPYAGQADAIFRQWQLDVGKLARYPNVFAKLGGIQMPLNGYDFHNRPMPPTSDDIVKAVGRYYRYTIETFGPDRCMFESNFPVEKVSGSYVILWNAFKKIAMDYSPAEKADLFHDTACRFYRLGSIA